MNQSILWPKLGMLFSLLVFMFLVGMTLSLGDLQSYDSIFLGVTLDFCVTIPLLYFLATRKTSIPNISVVCVFIFCLFSATYLIPQSGQRILNQVKCCALPLVEIGVVTFLILKSKAVFTKMKIHNTNLEWYDAIKEACIDTFPSRIGLLLAG